MSAFSFNPPPAATAGAGRGLAGGDEGKEHKSSDVQHAEYVKRFESIGQWR